MSNSLARQAWSRPAPTNNRLALNFNPCAQWRIADFHPKSVARLVAMADGEWQVTTRKRGNKRDRNQGRGHRDAGSGRLCGALVPCGWQSQPQPQPQAPPLPHPHTAFVPPAAAHGHASLPAAHRETPVGTDNPTPEQVDRWRARVEATGADVAASAFFRHLQRVLLGATLAPTTPPSGGSSSSGDVGAVLAVEGANDDLSPGRAGRPASDRWALLPRIKSMVMYGLGSLEQPGGAHIRCQLALAVRLAAMLPGLEGRPEAYDPVFSGLDSQALASLGFTVGAHLIFRLFPIACHQCSAMQLARPAPPLCPAPL